jgi:hypothetical protein
MPKRSASASTDTLRKRRTSSTSSIWRGLGIIAYESKRSNTNDKSGLP